MNPRPYPAEEPATASERKAIHPDMGWCCIKCRRGFAWLFTVCPHCHDYKAFPL